MDVVGGLGDIVGCVMDVVCGLVDIVGCVMDVLGGLGDIVGCVMDVLGGLVDIVGCVMDVVGGLVDIVGWVMDVVGGLVDIVGFVMDVVGGLVDIVGWVMNVVGGLVDIVGCVMDVIGGLGDIVGCVMDVLGGLVNIVGFVMDVVGGLVDIVVCVMDVVAGLMDVAVTHETGCKIHAGGVVVLGTAAIILRIQLQCNAFSDDDCADGWIKLKTKCFKVVTEPKNSTEAISYCHQIGSELTNVNDLRDDTSAIYINNADLRHLWAMSHSKIDPLWGSGNAGIDSIKTTTPVTLSGTGTIASAAAFGVINANGVTKPAGVKNVTIDRRNFQSLKSEVYLAWVSQSETDPHNYSSSFTNCSGIEPRCLGRHSFICEYTLDCDVSVNIDLRGVSKTTQYCIHHKLERYVQKILQNETMKSESFNMNVESVIGKFVQVLHGGHLANNLNLIFKTTDLIGRLTKKHQMTEKTYLVNVTIRDHQRYFIYVIRNSHGRFRIGEKVTNSEPFWSDSGCYEVSSDDSTVVCLCNHLTNFAVLMSTSQFSYRQIYQYELNIVSLVGCVLSIVCLVLTIAVYLLLWKSSVFPGPPAIIVVLTLAITKTEGFGGDYYCWLSPESGVIWSFAGPALTVVAINIAVLLNVVRTIQSSVSMMDENMSSRSKSFLRTLLILTPLFGLTWVFGVLSLSGDSLVFQYLFAVLNSLQVREGFRNWRRSTHSSSSNKTLFTEGKP
ncbi:hypothetical protein Btru_058732 [Bulinus truncatus]|nr:hypothetical protein Btru_058732 [Bulinus truncatus]